MDPIVQIFLSVVIFFRASILVLRRGWLCLRFGKGVLTLMQHIGLFALRIFKGDEVAGKRRKELMVQQTRQVVGYGDIFSGTISLLISIMLFIEAISRL